jgi:hypothetical protein
VAEEHESLLGPFLEDLHNVFQTGVLPKLDAVDTYLVRQVNHASRSAVADSGFTFSLLGRRGLHSSTFQLNLSRFRHRQTVTNTIVFHRTCLR